MLLRTVRWLAIPFALVLLATPLLFPSPAVGDNFQFWAAGHKRDVRALGTMLASAAAVTLPFEVVTPYPFGALLASSSERLAVHSHAT